MACVLLFLASNRSYVFHISRAFPGCTLQVQLVSERPMLTHIVAWVDVVVKPKHLRALTVPFWPSGDTIESINDAFEKAEFFATPKFVTLIAPPSRPAQKYVLSTCYSRNTYKVKKRLTVRFLTAPTVLASESGCGTIHYAQTSVNSFPVYYY